MRHAARLPPPPVFNDRCLLQLIAFCNLQIIDQTFGVCVFYLLLTLVYFFRYLYALDVCCQFVSGHATLKTCFRNALNMMPKSIQIHSKLGQNQPKWCQGVLRKRPWEQVGSGTPKKCQRQVRGTRHFGYRWAPRGPKIKCFGVRICQNLKT